VADVIARQRETGLDLVNEGDYTKGGDWLSFADDRFGGFEERERTGVPMIALGRDREEFAGFYQYATERGTQFYWDRIGMQMGLEAFRRRCIVRVDALNHALARIPEEQIRYHMCWGSWHAPHAHASARP
jgi:methionine synthase II (cobalamin-independent)